MPSNQVEMLVFQDSGGDYYVMPRKAWEQARVPRERLEEFRRLLKADQKTEVVQGRKPVKLKDLAAKDLTGDRAKRVRGGAVGAVNPVGVYSATSTLTATLTSANWSTRT